MPQVCRIRIGKIYLGSVTAAHSDLLRIDRKTSFSDSVTYKFHLALTATCLAMNEHLPGLYGGNQDAALESLFC